MDSHRSDERIERKGAETILDGIACRGARAMLGISQLDLCAGAKIGRNALNDFENGARRLDEGKLLRLRDALEALGAEFETQDGQGIWVRVGLGEGNARTRRARAYVRTTADRSVARIHP